MEEAVGGAAEAAVEVEALMAVALEGHLVAEALATPMSPLSIPTA